MSIAKFGKAGKDYGEMIRAIGLFGLTGGFLMLSPNFRNTLVEGFQNGVVAMDQHSPYSYVVAAIAAIGGFMVFVYKSSQPRQ